MALPPGYDRSSLPSGHARIAVFSGEKPSKILYGGLVGLALIKDLLDFAVVGMLPGISLVLSFCINFLILLLLMVFDKSGTRGNRRSNRLMVQGMVIGGVALVEGLLFGLNFIPIETFTIIILYQWGLKAWKKEKKIHEKENQKIKARVDYNRERSAKRRAFIQEQMRKREAALASRTQSRPAASGNQPRSPLAQAV